MKKSKRIAKDGLKNLARQSTQQIGDTVEASSSPFSREALANARVISQVDCKFIACAITQLPASQKEETDSLDVTTSRPSVTPRVSLVLIDQHAADERIRVERYLRSICKGFLDVNGLGIEKRLLDPPVPVLLIKAERDRLISSEKLKQTCQSWGFAMDSQKARLTDDGDDGFGMVYFKSVPEVVADKVNRHDLLLFRSPLKYFQIVSSY